MSTSKPLQGRTILVTRGRSQAGDFCSLLESAGARVLEVPAIEIRPRMSDQLDRAILNLESYDWLFLTSANAVTIFCGQVELLRPDLKPANLARPRICAIGPATLRTVEDYGYKVALIPALFQAEGILEEFVLFHQGNVEGLAILLPRAAQARELLPDELRKRGAVVDLIPVYDTVMPDGTGSELRRILAKERIDLITFTSSSTVHNLVQAAGNASELRGVPCAVIGPITAGTATDYGLNVAVQPKNWTVPDLAQAIIEYFRG